MSLINKMRKELNITHIFSLEQTIFPGLFLKSKLYAVQGWYSPHLRNWIRKSSPYGFTFIHKRKEETKTTGVSNVKTKVYQYGSC